jgi:hypothetical protein
MREERRVVTKAFTARPQGPPTYSYTAIPEGAIIRIDLKSKGYRVCFSYEDNSYVIDREVIVKSTRAHRGDA